MITNIQIHNGVAYFGYNAVSGRVKLTQVDHFVNPSATVTDGCDTWLMLLTRADCARIVANRN